MKWKKAMIFGHTRVSKIEQNLDRQIDQLKDTGCEKIFQDKITGMIIERIELNKMFKFAIGLYKYSYGIISFQKIGKRLF